MGKDIVKMTNGSFVFLFLFGCSGDRPSQSEAVFLQFGDLLGIRGGEVSEHWPVLAA